MEAQSLLGLCCIYRVRGPIQTHFWSVFTELINVAFVMRINPVRLKPRLVMSIELSKFEEDGLSGSEKLLAHGLW